LIDDADKPGQAGFVRPKATDADNQIIRLRLNLIHHLLKLGIMDGLILGFRLDQDGNEARCPEPDQSFQVRNRLRILNID
jgi:hypothetical protein